MVAIKENKMEAFKKIIELFPAPQQMDENGYSLFHEIIVYNRVEMLVYLLSIKDFRKLYKKLNGISNKLSLLHFAIAEGKKEMVNSILSIPDLKVYHKDLINSYAPIGNTSLTGLKADMEDKVNKKYFNFSKASAPVHNLFEFTIAKACESTDPSVYTLFIGL